MPVSWFGRLKPLEELWLIHDIPFAVPPLLTGLLLVCDIPRRKRGRLFFPAGTLLQWQREERPHPVKGEVESVILREQDGRYRPVCVRDEPKLRPVRGLVGGKNPPALCQCLVVSRMIVFRQTSPVASLMALNS
jgi:hypothetical protein